MCHYVVQASSRSFNVTNISLELSVKPLKERQIYAFDMSLKMLSIKSSLAHRVLEPMFKVGETLGTSPFHVSIFKQILKSKIGYVHGNMLS